MKPIPFEQVLANLPDGITVQDKDFSIIYQNAAMEQAFGSHVGDKCYAIYERRDQICEGCGLEKAFQTKEPNMVLRTAFGKDGTTAYWENSCFPLFDKEGNVVAGVEVCRNITDRVSLQEDVKERNIELGQLNMRLHRQAAELQKTLEERDAAVRDLRILIAEHERAEEKLRQLSRAVEQSPAMILLTDTEWRIQYINPRFFEVTGYREDEVLGNTPSLLKSDQTPQQTYEEMWQKLNEKGEWSGLLLDKKKDGSLFWGSTQISAIADDQGTVTHYLVTMEDVTERRKTEARLAQAEKMQALGEIASGIAHDINNMLLPILSLTRMTMKLLPPADRGTQRLGRVVEAAERARELVSRILTFGREGDVTKRALDLREVITATTALLRATIPSSIELRERLDTVPMMINGVIGDIQTVLMNLVSNATDAISGRVGSIDIALRRIEAGDPRPMAIPDLPARPYAVLSVTDTGRGMDAKMLEKIFQPFFTTKEVGLGTGLGLSMVHAIIMDHGGTVTVESTPGQGTTFDVYLPVLPPDEAVA